MGRYKVISGQNIYDVALAIYGSIEGLTDLLMNNQQLSLCDILKVGNELVFTDDFIINSDVVAYNKSKNIIPANGERSVYFKEPTLPELANIYISNSETAVELTVNGSGTIEFDWGDNSKIESVILTDHQYQVISHSFNSNISSDRRIRIYGNFKLRFLFLNMLKPQNIVILQPLYCRQMVLNNCSIKLDFLPLLKDISDIDLAELSLESLLPLVQLKLLRVINLCYIRVDQKVIDEYFITLVKEYSTRPSCTIYLTGNPSGEYKEPSRDENGKYIVNSGMEAIWLLTNEPAWNEGGYWTIRIKDTIYTTEP